MLALLAFVLFSPPTLAHPGETDNYGCHDDGEDAHCHEGMGLSEEELQADIDRMLSQPGL